MSLLEKETLDFIGLYSPKGGPIDLMFPPMQE